MTPSADMMTSSGIASRSISTESADHSPHSYWSFDLTQRRPARYARSTERHPRGAPERLGKARTLSLNGLQRGIIDLALHGRSMIVAEETVCIGLSALFNRVPHSHRPAASQTVFGHRRIRLTRAESNAATHMSTLTCERRGKA
jgi:hypothetical protein